MIIGKNNDKNYLNHEMDHDSEYYEPFFKITSHAALDAGCLVPVSKEIQFRWMHSYVSITELEIRYE